MVRARGRFQRLAQHLERIPVAYSGPDAADLHRAACASGSAVEVATGTARLLARIENRVGVIVFNSPERKNSLGDDFTPYLRAVIAQLREDGRVRCLLLTGAGDAFCSGGNVKSMAGSPDADDAAPPPAVPVRTDWTGAPLGDDVADDPNAAQKVKQATLTGALFEMSKPTIAALPGAAAGAGMSIALACDIRLGAQSAFITTGFRNVGLSGDYGGTWLLTQLVGPAKAKQLYFTGERVQSDELLRLGILNERYPDTELHATALKLAADIAAGPPSALRGMKANVNDATSGISFREALDGEAERLALVDRDQQREAIMSFVEKRQPNFD
jgi:enoyl-CoA hydratase/carnithine racemase